MCWPDFEAARRDSVRQQELDLFNKICQDTKMLRDFMADWKANTPPSRGPGHRRGGYAFARFKKRVGTTKGTTEHNNKVFKTKKAFIDTMESRGMTRAWGETEFNRRLTGNTRWKVGTCEDTGLPTVQCVGEKGEDDFNTKYIDTSIEVESKQQAGNNKNVKACFNEYAASLGVVLNSRVHCWNCGGLVHSHIEGVVFSCIDPKMLQPCSHSLTMSHSSGRRSCQCKATHMPASDRHALCIACPCRTLCCDMRCGGGRGRFRRGVRGVQH